MCACVCVFVSIDVASGIIAQVIGGVGFAIFGGEPMVVMLTTSPLSIMIMGMALSWLPICACQIEFLSVLPDESHVRV